MRRPLTIAELTSKASLPSSSYSYKMWIRSALSLFDHGLEYRSNGSLDEAFISLLKGVTIMLEIVPSLQEFRKTDELYLNARNKLEDIMMVLEKLKAQIQERTDEYNKDNEVKIGQIKEPLKEKFRAITPPKLSKSGTSISNLRQMALDKFQDENTITAEQLFNLISNSNSLKKVLLFDVRNISDYLDGHLSSKKCGIIAIDPNWLKVSNNAGDLESLITAFGPKDLGLKRLFQTRGEYELVVYCDSSSLSVQNDLTKLHSIIYEWEFQVNLSRHPKVLVGGFKALKEFIYGNMDEKNRSEWIEKGFGEVESSVQPEKLTDISVDIARDSAEYIRRASKQSPSRETKVDYIQTKQIQESPSSYSAKEINDLRLANEKFPEVAVDKNPKLPRRTSRFDDPFYAFQRISSKYPEINVDSPLKSESYTYPQLPMAVKPLESYRPVDVSDKIKKLNIEPNSAVIQQQQKKQVEQAPNFSNFRPSIQPSVPIAQRPLTSYAGSSSTIPIQQTAYSQPARPLAEPVIRPDVSIKNGFALKQPPTQYNPHMPSQFQNPVKTQMQSSPSMPQRAPDLTPNFHRSSSTDTLTKYVPPTINIPPPPSAYPISHTISGSKFAVSDSLKPEIMPRSSSKLAFSSTPPPVIPPTVPPKPSSTQLIDERKATFSLSSLSSSSIGVAGLKNLGNTCYLSSIIQCLSATIPLARYFLDGSYRRHINKHNPLGSQGSIVNSFAELVKLMWSENEMIIAPKKFKSVIGQFNESFKGNEQHDSQEFLAFLLDALHEDLNLSRRKGVIPIEDKEEETDDIPDPILLEKEWLKYKQKNWSIIVDLFQGILRSQLKCLTCGKVSTTFNPFMYLSLPIPEYNAAGKKGGPVYLEECIDKFVEEEILEGSNAWNCPRCKLPRKSVKRLTIAKLPIILLIHLKRFYFQGPFREKIETYVEFPLLSFDMSRNLVATNTSSISDSPPIYDLYAVSNHFGTLNGGHYMAQVRNSYQKQWLNFDDSRVTANDERQVKSKAAYILFYVQNGSKPSHNWWGINSSL